MHTIGQVLASSTSLHLYFVSVLEGLSGCDMFFIKICAYYWTCIRFKYFNTMYRTAVQAWIHIELIYASLC